MNVQLLEFFGAGTAAIISPVKAIRYEEEDLVIPLDPSDPSSQAGPLAQRLMRDMLNIQVNEFNYDVLDCLYHYNCQLVWTSTSHLSGQWIHSYQNWSWMLIYSCYKIQLKQSRSIQHSLPSPKQYQFNIHDILPNCNDGIQHIQSWQGQSRQFICFYVFNEEKSIFCVWDFIGQQHKLLDLQYPNIHHAKTWTIYFHGDLEIHLLFLGQDKKMYASKGQWSSTSETWIHMSPSFCIQHPSLIMPHSIDQVISPSVVFTQRQMSSKNLFFTTIDSHHTVTLWKWTCHANACMQTILVVHPPKDAGPVFKLSLVHPSDANHDAHILIQLLIAWQSKTENSMAQGQISCIHQDQTLAKSVQFNIATGTIMAMNFTQGPLGWNVYAILNTQKENCPSTQSFVHKIVDVGYCKSSQLNLDANSKILDVFRHSRTGQCHILTNRQIYNFSTPVIYMKDVPPANMSRLSIDPNIPLDFKAWFNKDLLMIPSPHNSNIEKTRLEQSGYGLYMDDLLKRLFGASTHLTSLYPYHSLHQLEHLYNLVLQKSRPNTLSIVQKCLIFYLLLDQNASYHKFANLFHLGVDLQFLLKAYWAFDHVHSSTRSIHQMLTEALYHLSNQTIEEEDIRPHLSRFQLYKRFDLALSFIQLIQRPLQTTDDIVLIMSFHLENHFIGHHSLKGAYEFQKEHRSYLNSAKHMDLLHEMLASCFQKHHSRTLCELLSLPFEEDEKWDVIQFSRQHLDHFAQDFLVLFLIRNRQYVDALHIHNYAKSVGLSSKNSQQQTHFIHQIVHFLPKSIQDTMIEQNSKESMPSSQPRFERAVTPPNKSMDVEDFTIEEFDEDDDLIKANRYNKENSSCWVVEGQKLYKPLACIIQKEHSSLNKMNYSCDLNQLQETSLIDDHLMEQAQRYLYAITTAVNSVEDRARSSILKLDQQSQHNTPKTDLSSSHDMIHRPVQMAPYSPRSARRRTSFDNAQQIHSPSILNTSQIDSSSSPMFIRRFSRPSSPVNRHNFQNLNASTPNRSRSPIVSSSNTPSARRSLSPFSPNPQTVLSPSSKPLPTYSRAKTRASRNLQSIFESTKKQLPKPPTSDIYITPSISEEPNTNKRQKVADSEPSSFHERLLSTHSENAKDNTPPLLAADTSLQNNKSNSILSNVLTSIRSSFNPSTFTHLLSNDINKNDSSSNYHGSIKKKLKVHHDNASSNENQYRAFPADKNYDDEEQNALFHKSASTSNDTQPSDSNSIVTDTVLPALQEESPTKKLDFGVKNNVEINNNDSEDHFQTPLTKNSSAEPYDQDTNHSTISIEKRNFVTPQRSGPEEDMADVTDHDVEMDQLDTPSSKTFSIQDISASTITPKSKSSSVTSSSSQDSTRTPPSIKDIEGLDVISDRNRIDKSTTPMPSLMNDNHVFSIPTEINDLPQNTKELAQLMYDETPSHSTRSATRKAQSLTKSPSFNKINADKISATMIRLVEDTTDHQTSKAISSNINPNDQNIPSQPSIHANSSEQENLDTFSSNDDGEDRLQQRFHSITSSNIKELPGREDPNRPLRKSKRFTQPHYLQSRSNREGQNINFKTTIDDSDPDLDNFSLSQEKDKTPVKNSKKGKESKQFMSNSKTFQETTSSTSPELSPNNSSYYLRNGANHSLSPSSSVTSLSSTSPQKTPFKELERKSVRNSQTSNKSPKKQSPSSRAQTEQPHPFSDLQEDLFSMNNALKSSAQNRTLKKGRSRTTSPLNETPSKTVDVSKQQAKMLRRDLLENNIVSKADLQQVMKSPRPTLRSQHRIQESALQLNISTSLVEATKNDSKLASKNDLKIANHEKRNTNQIKNPSTRRRPSIISSSLLAPTKSSLSKQHSSLSNTAQETLPNTSTSSTSATVSSLLATTTAANKSNHHREHASQKPPNQKKRAEWK